MKKVVPFLLVAAMLIQVAPARATETRDAWSDFGLGVAAVGVNFGYIPIKIAYAAVGGLVGALALGVTGGSMEAADGIWGPTLGGDYVVTADMLTGAKPIHFVGEKGQPPAQDF